MKTKQKTKIALIIPKIHIMMTGVYAIERTGNIVTLIYSDGSRESGKVDYPEWVEGCELPSTFEIVSKIQSQRGL